MTEPMLLYHGKILNAVEFRKLVCTTDERNVDWFSNFSEKKCTFMFLISEIIIKL